MNGDKKCTFEGMGGSRYVVQVEHNNKRTILTVCKSLDEARHYITLKYNGARRTVPLPQEMAMMNVVAKYRYTFQRTLWDKPELVTILVTQQKV